MKKKKIIIICLIFILLIAGIVILKFRPGNQGLYKVTILPSLGGDFTLPQSINDKGQVAGFSEVSRGNYHLFLWDKENRIRDLGPVMGGNIFLNNISQIAANVMYPNSNQRSFVWDQNTGRTILPTLGGKTSSVMGINNHGQVIGWAETSGGINHAFIWDAINGIRDLTPTSTRGTTAYSINDSGQAVVNEKNATLLVETDKDLTTTTLPTQLFGLLHINNNGNITGMVHSAQNKYDFVSWNPDSGNKIKTILQSKANTEFKMNDNNQLIITEQKYTGFLGRILFTHIENHMLDPKIGLISLDGYFSTGEYKNLCLYDINNEGCIIGAIQSTKGSKSVGILFEPIPEKMAQTPKKQIKSDSIVLQ